VGCRRHVVRDETGETSVTDVEVYVLLRTVDEADQMSTDDAISTVFRHDAVRFGKNVQDVGPGQLERLASFAGQLSALLGVGRTPVPGSGSTRQV
jgi:hypothetical protein